MWAIGFSPRAWAGASVSENTPLTVLLVGFGGPETLGGVGPFVESVLGRKPPEHVTLSAMDRYRAIGGGSPLPATTRRQSALVATELGRRGLEAKVHVGMMHARPNIDQAMAEIVAEGSEDLIVISLAPYRCEVSTDAYEAAVKQAVHGKGPRLHFGQDWNLAPGYLDALADMLARGLEQAPSKTPVVFTAHSLPVRMIEQGDPYADQLTSTAGSIAERLGLEAWQLAYQSVSAAAREPWLGPSVEEAMAGLAADGAKSVLVDPIGFISDHVETLYDNDIEHRARAEELGLAFYRCRCLNEHPGLINTLADLIVAASDHG
jgi:protoporphyrin/coproporphyrin ferrochelatase